MDIGAGGHMDTASWKQGLKVPTVNESRWNSDADMDFWRSLLNGSARSRFIRDLELQSIASRSPEDLARRSREEEMIAGSLTGLFPA